MAKNIIINGVTYNGVESLSLQTAEGETVEYFEASSDELPLVGGVVFGAGGDYTGYYKIHGETLNALAEAIEPIMDGSADGLEVIQMVDEAASIGAGIREAIAVLLDKGVSRVVGIDTLEELLGMVENVPEADGSGGGLSFNTCTVKLITPLPFSAEGVYTAVENGVICTKLIADAETGTQKLGTTQLRVYYLNGVLCQSAITVFDAAWETSSAVVSGGVTAKYSNTNCCPVYGFQAPVQNEAIGQIRLS